MIRQVRVPIKIPCINKEIIMYTGLILHEGSKLPPCPYVIAWVPLKCSSRNLQFPHWVPFTKEKMLWCPYPFKKETYRPALHIFLRCSCNCSCLWCHCCCRCCCYFRSRHCCRQLSLFLRSCSCFVVCLLKVKSTCMHRLVIICYKYCTYLSKRVLRVTDHFWNGYTHKLTKTTINTPEWA